MPKGLDAMAITLEIQNAFAAAYLDAVSSRSNEGVALFISDSPNHIDPTTEYAYYFTPAAARLCWQLLQKYHAKPCPEPDRSQIGWSGGDESFLEPANRQSDTESESD